MTIHLISIPIAIVDEGMYCNSYQSIYKPKSKHGICTDPYHNINFCLVLDVMHYTLNIEPKYY